MADPLKGFAIPVGWGTFFGFIVDNSVGQEIQAAGVPIVPVVPPSPPPPPPASGPMLDEAGGFVLDEAGGEILSDP
jgi:hypothetical protein